jgi:tRNA(Ile)-lysidine synthase
LPGRALVPETGTVVEALRVKPEWETSGYNPVQLLDPDTLPSRLAVRNWRPGDRFWPAHTKSPKKIKELLQERQIPALDRRLWPVVVNGDEIVWVRGFPAPAGLQAKPGGEALLIRERPLAEGQQ